MIFLLKIAFLIGLYLVYRKLKPFIEFSRKNKHSNFATFRLLKAGYKDCMDKVLTPLIRDGYNSFWLGIDLVVFLTKPEDIKIALNSEKCFDKPDFYKFFFNYGILVENGEKAKQLRKSLNPLFSNASLKSFIPIINSCFNEFLQKNNQHMEEGEFDMKQIVSKFTIASIFSTILKGEEAITFTEKEVTELIYKGEDFLESCSKRFFKFWIHPNFLFKFSKEYQVKNGLLSKIVDLFINFVVKNNINVNFNENGYYGCMKNHLIKMNLEEILESYFMFVGTSYETTSSSISSTLFLLAANPEKQQKIYDEVSSVLASHEDEVTEEMMNNMEYLEFVIKESLRLIPVSVLNARYTTDDVEFTNFTVPKHSVLFLPVREVHRDKKIWGEDAWEFKPERFESENLNKIHPYAYFPFFAGNRMCPGYKYAMITMKIFISRFIMKYRVSTNMKYEDLELVFGVTTDFKKRPLLRLEKRY